MDNEISLRPLVLSLCQHVFKRKLDFFILKNEKRGVEKTNRHVSGYFFNKTEKYLFDMFVIPNVLQEATETLEEEELLLVLMARVENRLCDRFCSHKDGVWTN